LEVQLDNIPSSTGIPALISGQIDVAQLGGSETMSATAAGADLAVLGIISPVYPFVFMVPGSITTMDQMRGKKIGVSNAGSTSDIATRVMLRKSGLNPDTDVTILAVGSLENRVAALTNGAIDGGMATPPDQLVLEEKGFHAIYDMAQQKLPSAGDVIAVKRSWLDQNQTVAQAYVDSMIQGTMRSRSDREFTLKVLEKYLKTSDQHALNVTYDYFVGEVTPVYPVIGVENFDDAISQLSQSNDKIKTFDVRTMLVPQFVQSAMDRKVGQ
jgi:NitT/TauT family transport system substrate-binding protein